MLEVKLSEEEAKSGADPASLAELIEAVRGCGNLRLLGLMTMPPWTEDPEASRPYFRRLRELAERHGLRQLSMGMSHDLEAAIEEGATCVRVGTALFGERQGVTVGFYSPMPPARTGVADYAAALAPSCGGTAACECRRGRPLGPATWRSTTWAITRCMRQIYRRALERPGVVTLHDAVLHHFLLGQLDEAAYIEEFVYNYGEWNRGLAGELWRGRASSATDSRYFQYALLRRVAERALAVVVHNPAAARAVKEHAPEARVVEIPHLFQAPALPGEEEVARYRRRLGVEPGTFLFGVFGYLRESKRLPAVLEAFADVHRENPRTALLVAGEFVSTDLERAVEPLLGGAGVVRLAVSRGARVLAGGGGRGCLHQPAVSGGGGDFRDRHPADGDRQAGPGDGRGGVRAVSRGRLPAHRARRGGAGVLAPAHDSANI